MRLSQFAFLADENIHPEVVAFLQKRGLDVATAKGAGLAGLGDSEILRVALETGRVVLTHDADCGALAVAAANPYKESSTCVLAILKQNSRLRRWRLFSRPNSN